MKRLLLGATALAICAGFAGPAYADFTLNILHINDFHSPLRIDHRHPIPTATPRARPQASASAASRG